MEIRRLSSKDSEDKHCHVHNIKPKEGIVILAIEFLVSTQES